MNFIIVEIFLLIVYNYVVIDPRTGVSTDIFPTGKTGNVLANFLPPDQVILSKENILIHEKIDFRDTNLQRKRTTLIIPRY